MGLGLEGGLLDCDIFWGGGDGDRDEDRNLQSEGGVVAVSPGFTGWRGGLGAPLLPSAITCRMV